MKKFKIILFVAFAIIILIIGYNVSRESISQTSNVSSNAENLNDNDSSLKDNNNTEQIQAIVRDYIINNPEVIIESLNTLQQRKVMQAQRKSTDYIISNKDQIYNTKGVPFVGERDATKSLVVFFDYNCGYCKEADNNIEKLVEQNKSAKVIFRPIGLLNDQSVYIAKVTIALYKIAPEKFLSIHRALMRERHISKAFIDNLLKHKGVDVNAINTAINTHDVSALYDDNVNLAQNIGVVGTPAFVIGDELIPGLLDVQQLEEYLKK